MVSVIVHIAERAAWEAAKASGVYAPVSLKDAGFVHASLPRQWVAVANALFRGRKDLVLLVIDPKKLEAEVRFEALGTDEAYPHIYGPIPLEAVVAVYELVPGPEGRFGPLPGL